MVELDRSLFRIQECFFSVVQVIIPKEQFGYGMSPMAHNWLVSIKQESGIMRGLICAAGVLMTLFLQVVCIILWWYGLLLFPDSILQINLSFYFKLYFMIALLVLSSNKMVITSSLLVIVTCRGEYDCGRSLKRTLNHHINQRCLFLKRRRKTHLCQSLPIQWEN